MKKFFELSLLTLSLFVLCRNANAQQDDLSPLQLEVDSLQKILASNPPDTTKAFLNYDLGVRMNMMSRHQQALNYWFKALKYWESVNDLRQQGKIYNLMQLAYNEMDMYAEARQAGEKALEMLKDYPRSYCYALLNIAITYAYGVPRMYGEAEKCLLELEKILETNPNPYLQTTVIINMGDLYWHTCRFRDAEVLFRQALKIYTQEEDIDGICNAKVGVAAMELYKNNYSQCRQMALETVEMAKKQGITLAEHRATWLLNMVAVAEGNWVESLLWNYRYDSIDKEIVSVSKLNAMQQLRIEYETEKKEAEIVSLQKQRQLWLILTIVGATLAVTALLALLFFRRLKRKREQLVATQAVLDGETAERTRLSRDLHDGLGGMLSAVKLNMNGIKTTVELDNEDIEKFNKAVALLDESINEMRRVAHHLMPDSLTRQGVKSALYDFCSAIPGVEFNWFGNDDRFDAKLEVVVYRIVHELVNNALKHAEAEKILVQIVKRDKRIAIAVEDNGQGFDPESETAGMGMKNIRQRVASFGGMLDIRSAPGQGAEINVEFDCAEQ